VEDGHSRKTGLGIGMRGGCICSGQAIAECFVKDFDNGWLKSRVAENLNEHGVRSPNPVLFCQKHMGY